MPHRYFPHTSDDIARMLKACGATSLEDLYIDIPEELRLKNGYNIPKGMSEPEVKEAFAEEFAKCKPLACFAGAGAYNHYTPEVIPYLTSRSEFLTAYTPYQPEISQGTLQYIFEYQSMICQLTGLDVSNASMYDGATATAEAMIMAVNSTRKKRRILISATINPRVLDVVKTYALYHNIAVDIIPQKDGATDKAELELMLGAGDVAGVIASTPNYYGILEDFEGWAEKIHDKKALFIINSPATTLSVIKSQGQWGADIATGDAQSLGMPLNYGGPYLGYMSCTSALMRKLPGRIVGATTDDKGQRVFVLTLQAREQHIRREKATSNICSNQGLMTLHAAIYMSLMGAKGLEETNRLSCNAAHYLAERLAETGKLKLSHPGRPYLNEFKVTLAALLTTHTVLKALEAQGILGGVAIDDNEMIIACTELTTAEQIEKYVSTVKSL